MKPIACIFAFLLVLATSINGHEDVDAAIWEDNQAAGINVTESGNENFAFYVRETNIEPKYISWEHNCNCQHNHISNDNAWF